MQHLSRYDWVIFTSANGVRAFMDRLFHMGLDVRALGRARLAVIGPATAQALRDYSLVADVVPDTFQAEGLLEVLEPRLLGGTRLLLARAEQARDVLPEGLARLGAKLDVVPVYRALPPASVPPEAAEALAEGRVDILTFTSSSTVHNFAGLVGKDALSDPGRPGRRGLHRPHHHRDAEGIRHHAPDRAGRVHHPGPGRGDCGIF